MVIGWDGVHAWVNAHTDGYHPSAITEPDWVLDDYAVSLTLTLVFSQRATKLADALVVANACATTASNQVITSRTAQSHQPRSRATTAARLVTFPASALKNANLPTRAHATSAARAVIWLVIAIRILLTPTTPAVAVVVAAATHAATRVT